MFGMLAFLAASVAARPPSAEVAPQPWSFRTAIPHLVCSKSLNDGTGRYWVNSGTGVRVSSTLVLTVNHVSGDRICAANGAPVFRARSDANLDYAEIYSPSSDPMSVLKVKCEQLVPGQPYWAYGYAAGHKGRLYRQLVFYMTRRNTDGSIFDNDAVFIGPEAFIPGMSGGAIFNNDGFVVALVQGYNTSTSIPYSMGRALVDTPYCKGPIA